MDRRFSVLVGTIPIWAGRVLLLQRSDREKFLPGVWGLPCGKVDFGEDLEAAALRELKEEAGISGRIIRIVGYSAFHTTKNGVQLHNLQVNFEVAAPGDRVVLDKSNQAFRWVPVEDIQDAGLDDFTVRTIQQAVPVTVPDLR